MQTPMSAVEFQAISTPSLVRLWIFYRVFGSIFRAIKSWEGDFSCLKTRIGKIDEGVGSPRKNE